MYRQPPTTRLIEPHATCDSGLLVGTLLLSIAHLALRRLGAMLDDTCPTDALTSE